MHLSLQRLFIYIDEEMQIVGFRGVVIGIVRDFCAEITSLKFCGMIIIDS